MSAPIRVVATLPVRPDQAEAARAALATLAAASLADDEGCLQYDAFESATAPGTFVTIESWESQAAIDAHMGAPHVAEAFGVLGPILAGDVAIHPLRAV
ncbi:putative quinol monooxygenase [Nocardioides marmotae]|uniref:putative quinol monooxygenase n=1 Tax=Nocardioides marmotae TaxID=2663857 RepID=UPI0012B56D84|nr:putative quinol monooxygenase [Nocardioides marmotae]MBC9732303.1 antibiotic biosynthesis monooxygenase [Nocardioides marmotae]MTB83424.1 antibiotic biosynthesis monooxygenase [Nocardioides marmotae]